uniref:Uncharacterized protein n=1 Tax=Anolis carolinensis TaxID=28377 RepID=A0A803TRE3_ANOCA
MLPCKLTRKNECWKIKKSFLCLRESPSFVVLLSFLPFCPLFFPLALNKIRVLEFPLHINSKKACLLIIVPEQLKKTEQVEYLEGTEGGAAIAIHRVIPKVLKKKMTVSIALFALFCVLPFTFSSSVIHYTSSNGICGDKCDYHGYKYTWCKQYGGNGKDWDYCSLEEGLDASGKKCATSCDFFGTSYRFCYHKDGGWHYCGLHKTQDFLEYSQENHICLKNCRATQGSFHCETIYGLQRCSPFHDITPTGLPCHNNYRCATYGHSTYRCLIDDNNSIWDYCGRKSLDGCVWVSYENSSSQVDVCTLSNILNEGKVIFLRERRDSMLPPSEEEFKNHLVHISYIFDIYAIAALPYCTIITVFTSICGCFHFLSPYHNVMCNVKSFSCWARSNCSCCNFCLLMSQCYVLLTISNQLA